MEKCNSFQKTITFLLRNSELGYIFSTTNTESIHMTYRIMLPSVGKEQFQGEREKVNTMEFDLKKREFYWFNEICRIPHGSRNEKQLSDFIVRFAKEHHLSCRQDSVWNVIIDKPASKGNENAAPLIIQGHIDMVCDKREGSEHDFMKNPLDLYTENGLLKTRDTTLGADDGLGAAWMLALLEDDTLVNPPLECIFTVMEELGLLGASNLCKEDVKADRMISVDSMDEAITDLCSAGGCYGTAVSEMTMILNTDPTYRFSVDGLIGGHSGADIHRERVNADKMIARMLADIRKDGIYFNLVEMKGGSKSNAITRTAEVIFTAKNEKQEIINSLQNAYEGIVTEYRDSDPDIAYHLEQIDTAETHADRMSTDNTVDFMYLVPNGFQHRSMAIEGLTVTSLNMGVVSTENGKVTIHILIRSMMDTAAENLNRQISLLAERTGIQYEMGEFYPGWNYSEVSPMRDKFAEACRKNDRELKINAVHGGLEAGVFAKLKPGIDIITIGADCRYYHTFEEELDLASFHHAFGILKDTIAMCADD